MSIIVALLIFTVIIVIHELGHFLLARKAGIFVTEFSIGMGPRLVTVVKVGKKMTLKFLASQDYCDNREDWHDRTRYSIKLLPLGGSCAMLGEDEELEDERSFNKKKVWPRISVVAAGPIFNFILAFILSMVIVGSIGYDPAKISLLYNGMPMKEAGFMEGDKITAINGSKIHFAREISTYLTFHPLDGSPVEISFERNGEKKTLTVVPKQFTLDEISSIQEETLTEYRGRYTAAHLIPEAAKHMEAIGLDAGYIKEDEAPQSSSGSEDSEDSGKGTSEKETEPAKKYQLGFSYSAPRESVNVPSTIKYSFFEVKYWIVTTVKSLGQMIQGKVSKDDIAGPVGIFQIIGDTYTESKTSGIWYTLLNMFNISILLSANLGVMNLLPIPALDGGRLVFLFIEVIRGKPVPQEKEGMVHMIGLVLLLILMAFIMVNDIGRLFR